MSDAPTWPNLVFNCTILICPIMIWLLLLMFPPVFVNLLKHHYRSGGTLLHQQCQPSPQLHHPIRKKREFRKPPTCPHPQLRPKCYAVIFFAAAWFIYKLGCNIKSFFQRAKNQLLDANGVFVLDIVFEQRRSKARTRLTTPHQCALIPNRT